MKKIIMATGFFLMAFQACAEPVRLHLSVKDCRRLLDDSASYVAGVSTTGKAVAPADLNQNADVSLPDLDNMIFPVYLDLKRDFPFWESKMKTGFVPIGRIEFKDGDVFVNGTLVSKNKQNVLKEVCRKNIDKNNLKKVQ